MADHGQMGHFMFLVLHIVCLFFGGLLLVLTIPLHLIYIAIKAGQGRHPAEQDVPTPQTHVRCPDCRELVRADARKCKHCGVPLAPQGGGQA